LEKNVTDAEKLYKQTQANIRLNGDLQLIIICKKYSSENKNDSSENKNARKQKQMSKKKKKEEKEKFNRGI